MTRRLRPVRDGDRPPPQRGRRRRRGASEDAATKRRALWGRVRSIEQLPGMDRETAEEVMRDHVEQLCGDRSTKALSHDQHADLMRRLDGIINERPTTRRGRAEQEDGDALLTPEQNHAIVQLGLAIGLDQARLQTWVRKHMAKPCEGRPWPQTRAQGIKVFEGLQAWLVRQPRSQPGQVLRRVNACQEFADLSPWEVQFLADLAGRKGFPTADRTREGMFFKGHSKQLVKLAEIERLRGKAEELAP